MTQKLNHKQSLISQIEAHIDQLEQYLDSFIDSGSEHELFISSYIHGHFSVVAANFLNTIQNSTDEQLACFNLNEVKRSFQLELKSAVEQALISGELEQTDENHVKALLTTMFEQ